jgi:hypothetical protein
MAFPRGNSEAAKTIGYPFSKAQQKKNIFPAVKQASLAIFNMRPVSDYTSHLSHKRFHQSLIG